MEKTFINLLVGFAVLLSIIVWSINTESTLEPGDGEATILTVVGYEHQCSLRIEKPKTIIELFTRIYDSL